MKKGLIISLVLCLVLGLVGCMSPAEKQAAQAKKESDARVAEFKEYIEGATFQSIYEGEAKNHTITFIDEKEAEYNRYGDIYVGCQYEVEELTEFGNTFISVHIKYWSEGGNKEENIWIDVKETQSGEQYLSATRGNFYKVVE